MATTDSKWAPKVSGWLPSTTTQGHGAPQLRERPYQPFQHEPGKWRILGPGINYDLSSYCQRFTYDSQYTADYVCMNLNMAYTCAVNDMRALHAVLLPAYRG